MYWSFWEWETDIESEKARNRQKDSACSQSETQINNNISPNITTPQTSISKNCEPTYILKSHSGMKKMFFVCAYVCYQYKSAHILLPFPLKTDLNYTFTTKVKCPQHFKDGIINYRCYISPNEKTEWSCRMNCKGWYRALSQPTSEVIILTPWVEWRRKSMQNLKWG
jgi:hypothetical protein